MVTKAVNNTAGWAQHVTFAMAGEAHGSQVAGYPVPGSLRLKAPEFEGQVQLERVLLQDDPLDDLPKIFRWVISLMLNLRPHRAWALSPFEVSCPNSHSSHIEPVNTLQRAQGTGVTAVTFLNPLPGS
jgi:hypothetical protein